MPRRSVLTRRNSETTPRQFHQFYTDTEREEVLAKLCLHLTTHGVGQMIAYLDSIGVQWSTVYYWMQHDLATMQRVRDAQLAGTFVVAEEILRIADDASGDYELDERTGKVRVVPETVARAKLRIDSRWRLLSCLHPIVWGSRMASIGSPEEQEAREAAAREAAAETTLTDAERAHRVARLLGVASSRPVSRITVAAENGPIE